MGRGDDAGGARAGATRARRALLVAPPSPARSPREPGDGRRGHAYDRPDTTLAGARHEEGGPIASIQATVTRRPAPELGGGRRHVVFVGAMGSGKSTIGRLVAGRLGRRFRDNDAALVRRRGSRASAVAADRGMAELHRLEADVLLDHLRGARPAVIAAAASVVDDERVPPALAESAVTVWLRGTPDVLVDRARRGTHRPLRDQPDSMRALVEARAERFASVADVTVDVTTARPAAVVERTLEGLAEHGIAPRPRRTRRRP